ncbi:MAG: hypothetical protein JOZ07_03470 [Solirubrobacterales bacterium]|nr:hypothetical protein [Solirubrobacterales bacterium]
MAFADGFHTESPFGRAKSMWAANRDNDEGTAAVDRPSFDEQHGVTRFNSSQVVLRDDGVHLNATHRPSGKRNRAGQPIDYVSGCLSSQPASPVGGATGFPIHGFGFEQLDGGIVVLETELRLPRFLEGMDVGWWAQDGEGHNEQDFLEFTDYAAGHPGQWSATAAWIDHQTDHVSQGQALHRPFQTDGALHRYTTVIDGVTRTVRTYVDGSHDSALDYDWPPVWPRKPISLLLSFDLRAAYPGQAPTFVGTRAVVVRSVACYQDGAHAGHGIIGGGIAHGTTIATEH